VQLLRPDVLANGVINLRLTPSVSELDYMNAVVISGTAIPSITKRDAYDHRVARWAELRHGRSSQSDNSGDINQVPWLGSVPVSAPCQQQVVPTTRNAISCDRHASSCRAGGAARRSRRHLTKPCRAISRSIPDGRAEVRKQYTDYVTSEDSCRALAT